MKVGNRATLFLWEWALSRDKNNHRALALSASPHFLVFYSLITSLLTCSRLQTH